MLYSIEMYIRFVSTNIDNQSNSLQGVFTAIHRLRGDNRLASHEENEVIPALKWLAMHLKAPICLEDKENFRALSWFKEEAKEPMKRIWVLVNVLREHGISIQVLKSNNPGVVIYEDGWQIVAKPYKKGKRYNQANPAEPQTRHFSFLVALGLRSADLRR